MKVKSESEVAQSCLTPSHPMDCSLPGSSVHGICQARVLEWGAIAVTEGYLVMIDSVFEGQTLPELKVKKKQTDFIPVLDVTVWVIARRNRFFFLLLDSISKILVFMFCF